MIKLSAITEMFKYYGDTRYETNDLTTEFDDSKDIFFKTIGDEYIAILKIDDENSMLFEFDEPQAISLWMKNTFIPLDAIYFNENGKILELNENLKPHSKKSVISKNPCKYVLEVNANTIKNLNIQVGDYIKIKKIN